jgi:DNA replication protein DnaC
LRRDLGPFCAAIDNSEITDELGALFDRLMHHVNILEMNGERYRLNQSKSRRVKN